MKPAAFDYQRIASADEACAVLAQMGEDARILAGGQSLMAVLNMRLAQPQRLLDISRCAPLQQLRVAQGALQVGAAVTQATLEWRPGLAQELPLLQLAFPHISHFQVRNRGTVAGSIAHADPSAELPLCLLALQGEVLLKSARASRRVEGRGLLHRHAADHAPCRRTRRGRALPARAAGPGLRLRGVLGAPWRLRRLRRGRGGRRPAAAHRRRRCRRPARGTQLPAAAGRRAGRRAERFRLAAAGPRRPQASAALRRQLVRQLGRRVAVQALADRSRRLPHPSAGTPA
jgi:2-furoyl-CoA dehydrogenase FAD binding subunit